GQRHRTAIAVRWRWPFLLGYFLDGSGRGSHDCEPNQGGPGWCGTYRDVSKWPDLALRLARGDLAAHHLPVACAGLRLPGHALADRIEDGQALADQPGGDLAQAVGAVEHADVGAGQPGRSLLDDQRQLVDQHLVKRD